MSEWKVTGGYHDSASRVVFTVTKGTRRLDHREQDELEALLNPWRPIESAPRGNKVATGSWLEWGNAHPEYDSNGAVFDAKQELAMMLRNGQMTLDEYEVELASLKYAQGEV